MGLDIVELILTIEEEFDIELPDAEMERARTPRDIADYIYQKYQEYDKNKCSSQVGFYKLRKLLMEHFGFERHQLKPDTKLQELFGNDIRAQWKKLNKLLDSNMSYPLLQFTPSGKKITLVLSAVIAFAYFYLFTQHTVSDLDDVLLIFILTSPFAYLLLHPFYAKIIPDDYSTLSKLIKFTGESNKITHYKTYQSILDKVIEISIEQLNLSPDAITPDSQYVQDLGAC